jgi:hypothetical protein
VAAFFISTQRTPSTTGVLCVGLLGSNRNRIESAAKQMHELRFATKGKTAFWTATDEAMADWQTDFPHLNIEAECHKARAWCAANPTKRKTPRGMPRFLVAWFMRAEGTGRMERRVQRDVCVRCGGYPRCMSFRECTAKMLARASMKEVL